MRKKLLIGLVLAALLLILLLTLYPRFTGNNILPKITINLHPDKNAENTSTEPEIDLSCPTELRLTYFVEANNTPTLQDDFVFLSILNPDEQEYTGSIFINDKKEVDTPLPAYCWTNISSSILTKWWRQVVEASEDSEPVPEDYVSESIGTFLVNVRVEGCDGIISIVTPNNPSGENSAATGGGGGGGGGGGSAIRITKSSRQFVND